MKIRGNLLDMLDHQIVRQNSVECDTPFFSTEFGNGGKARGLVQTVDPGIGSPGTVNFDNLAGETQQGIFKSALDGGLVRLDLPAVVVGAVVGNQKEPV